MPNASRRSSGSASSSVIRAADTARWGRWSTPTDTPWSATTWTRSPSFGPASDLASCSAIMERDRSFYEEGRKRAQSYQVPGQCSANTDEPRDAKAFRRDPPPPRGTASHAAHLRAAPAVVVIPHVRNPWDKIASIFGGSTTGADRDLAEVPTLLSQIRRSRARNRRGRLGGANGPHLTGRSVRDPAADGRVLEGSCCRRRAFLETASARATRAVPTPPRVRWPTAGREHRGERRGCEGVLAATSRKAARRNPLVLA